MTTRVLFDTSVYITVLRDESFARTFRSQYVRAVPRTHFSSIVVQELLAGMRTLRHRRQAAALYEPFEKAGRMLTPTHRVWKEAGIVLATIADRTPQFRSKFSPGFLNDILIALSSRSIGAAVVTRNAEDFRLIREFRSFTLEVI